MDRNDFFQALSNALALTNASRTDHRAMAEMIGQLGNSDIPGDNVAMVLSATIALNTVLMQLTADEWGLTLEDFAAKFGEYITMNPETVVGGTVYTYNAETEEFGQFNG